MSPADGWLGGVTGYDASFLGPDDALTVPLPVPHAVPGAAPRELRRLDHPHFTVLLDPARRLAAATACTIDGARLRPLPRSGTWRLDPQAPADEQAGPELYARNPLDRGHLVRRLDPMWGTVPEAQAAGRATFVYSNAAPQVDRFNQSKELWNGLEDHVLAFADVHDHRVVVHTGCVFDPTDPVYRGVALPRRFWKVAAWAAAAAAPSDDPAGRGGVSALADDRESAQAAASQRGPARVSAGDRESAQTGASQRSQARVSAGDRESAQAGTSQRELARVSATTEPPMLRAAAFVLDQSPQLDVADLRAATAQALAVGDVPPLGPYRTFQVPVADVERLTGLDLGALVAADVLAGEPAAGRRDVVEPLRVGTVPSSWSPVTTPADLTLAP
jgi:endonuclease G